MTTTAPPLEATRSHAPRPLQPYLLAPALTVALVGLGLALGWHGVDDAASVHRIDEYRRYGYALWDASWYGGQWTLDYSIAFAPVAATLGLGLLSVLASLIATVSFQDLVAVQGLPGPVPRSGPAATDDRLTRRLSRVTGWWGALTRDAGTRPWAGAALAAAVVFAIGNLASTSIGQVPFLAGEALGLAAVAVASRRRWVIATVLALASAALSPLSGLFVGLAAAAWILHTVPLPNRALARWPGLPALQRSWRSTAAITVLAAAALIPTMATTFLFPGEGQMPFGFVNMAWDLLIAAVLWLVTGKAQRVLRTGIAIYGLGLIGCWAFPSPIGVNMGRLGDVLALPLAVLVLWPRRRLLLTVVAIPLIASQWGPVWSAVAPDHSTPSTTAAFYQPLNGYLAAADPGGIDGRVEVVPTEYHWEAVYVANIVPLARGWERQSDVTLNSIFYSTPTISPAAYHRWLVDNGVRWVALPNAPLDYAGTAEAKVVRGGHAGLTLAWTSTNWRVYAVNGATGLVVGDGALQSMGNSSMTIATEGPGVTTIRERYNADWRITAGTGCVTEEPGKWIGLRTTKAETVSLRLALTGASSVCPSTSS